LAGGLLGFQYLSVDDIGDADATGAGDAAAIFLGK
jgi:hypothetical protein